MINIAEVRTFEQWRDAARKLLVLETAPPDVRFLSDSSQPSLFDDIPSKAIASTRTAAYTVPPQFLELAR